ncbi:RND family efflux transporter, MFP subunit [Shimia gijangensis]|uniref:RND family efflux transporter, MFP subunit n=1 Tax=Shimia gijangensis TaxID=1470563 RepID=A0A1M6QEJ2_9RHOB|nr:efflux RND transporter periplasmic adaptor subunit [Shimia gijangensis]SHK18616.1 RND family efflux transporter, MFP subunit [Shimia gijangensis]
MIGSIRKLTLAILVFVSSQATAGEMSRLVEVPEWKAVFARVETRDRVPARSRLGGVLETIEVSEGTEVQKNQVIGVVKDEKLRLQMAAVESQMRSLESQLQNASTELTRGESLLKQGVTTKQRVDSLRTQVEVIEGRMDVVRAEADVLSQRTAEGAVLAPISGRVLRVPLTEGSVVMPGEEIASIGGGGFFLRLAIPERHAAALVQGAKIAISGLGPDTNGTLAKIYPLIENGRVVADVEVEELVTDYVDARVLVRLPVGSTSMIVVPKDALMSQMGMEFVTVQGKDGQPVQRTVVAGETHEIEGTKVVEILSGLAAGETLVMADE